MEWMNVGLAVLLGLGLSASTGLNTWLPLLLLSGAAHFNLAGVQLSGSFSWLGSQTALLVLLIATLIEVIADKIPAVDHALHAISTFIRPAAATVAMAAAFTHLDPMVAGMLGLMIGAPTALGFHALKSAARIGSSVTTFGCANPVLSLIDDVASLLLSIVAIFIPILVPVALGGIGIALWMLVRKIRASRPVATA